MLNDVFASMMKYGAADYTNSCSSVNRLGNVGRTRHSKVELGHSTTIIAYVADSILQGANQVQYGTMSLYLAGSVGERQ